MRVIGWFIFFVLLGFGAGLAFTSTAGAQGSGSDPGGGSSAGLARILEDGDAQPRRIVRSNFQDLALGLTFAFDRHRFLGWASSRALGDVGAGSLPPGRASVSGAIGRRFGITSR